MPICTSLQTDNQANTQPLSFYRPDSLPAAQPTVSKHCRQVINTDKMVGLFTHTHTHPFNGPFSRTTRVGRYQKGETNLDFTEARHSEWQWHQMGICKSAPRSRQITTPAPHRSVFLQAGCPSCRPTNSVKALNKSKLS